MEAGLKAHAPTAELDIGDIMRILPHRYPFLMLERMVAVRAGESAIGIKNVSINEQYFVGHFPEQPVMPGVMIVEALAQTAAALVVHSIGAEAQGKLVYFMAIDNARFRQPVWPGDQLELHVIKERHRGTVWRFRGEAKVKGRLCAEGVFTAMIVDPADG